MQHIQHALASVILPKSNSHKGENGKLLFIGGSELFHAPTKWALDTASRFVDMLFYASVPQNNALITEAKGAFWDGIVVPQDEIETYISEADCVLIGPGMERVPETAEKTNELLALFPQKKWVVDAGALQMADPNLFTNTMILTPHQKELERVAKNMGVSPEVATTVLREKGVTLLVKGATDMVYTSAEVIPISGGSPGMTKGGTGDVLAGIIAGLYATNDAITATVVGSYVNKKAGEKLAENVGPFFNASDLAAQVPKTIFSLLS